MTTSPTLSAVAIESGRLVLRKARDTDREGVVEVLTDPEVRAYLGGPRRREDVERSLDQAGTVGTTAAAAGSYAIADKQATGPPGFLGLSRRPADRPGHVTGEGGGLELSYVLRRDAWGAGLAFEAAAAALRTATAELPDQPVLIVIQTANRRARRLSDRLGFRRSAPSRSRRAPDPRRGLAGLVLGSMTGERANQRGASPGMPRADRRLRSAVAQRDKREIVISSNNYRSPNRRGWQLRRVYVCPCSYRPILVAFGAAVCLVAPPLRRRKLGGGIDRDKQAAQQPDVGGGRAGGHRVTGLGAVRGAGSGMLLCAEVCQGDGAAEYAEDAAGDAGLAGGGPVEGLEPG